MAEIDPVIFEFKAKVDGYLSTLNSTTAKVDQLLGTQEKKVKQLEAQFKRSSGQISGTLKGLASTLATYFTGRELVGLIDNFTRLQNSLRVAGLEGGNLASVQEKLFDIANKYGVSVNALADLYSKNSMTAKDLGASQAQLLQITEMTSQALRITGVSSDQASGAILGLSQALASGTVHAEEFGQINEGGLRPLLQVAAASERWGGSVSKLRNDIIKGNVTSQEFFQAILAGSKLLEEQASKSVGTLAGALQHLSNELVKYVGGAASSQGATGALTFAIDELAKNIDTIIPIIAALAAALGVKAVAGAVAARAALMGTAASMGIVGAAAFALEAKLAGAATGMEALQFAMASVNWPMVAVMALVAGIGYLASVTSEADKAATELNSSMADVESRLAGFRKKADDAALATGKMSDSQQALITSTAAMTGEVDLLAQAWARVAAQAKAAAVEEARALLVKATANRDQARMEYERQHQGDGSQFYRGIGMAPPKLANSATQKGYRDQNLQDGLNALYGIGKAGQPGSFASGPRIAQADQDVKDAQALLTETMNRPLSSFRPSYGGGAGKKKKGGGSKGSKGPSGPSAEEIEQRFNQNMAQLDDEALRAKLDLATDADARADIQKDLLHSERDQRIAQIEADKNFTRAQKDAQIAKINAIYGTPATTDAQGNIVAAARPGLLAQGINRDADRKKAQLDQSLLEEQQRTLEEQVDLTTSAKDRKEVEKKILAIQQQIERDRLEETIATGEMPAAARGELAAQQRTQREKQRISQLGPGASYARDLGIAATNVNDAVQSIEVQGLEKLNDGLVDAIMNAKNLGDVFKNVANQIIGDLLRIAIQQAIIKPLADKLFGGGGGTSSLISNTLSFANSAFKLFGRASGGYVAPGQMVRVNESATPGKVEGFMSRDGGQIIPLGRMNVAQSSQRSGPAVVQVHVMEGQLFEPRIQAISGDVSVQVVRGAAPALIDASARETMARAGRPRM